MPDTTDIQMQLDEKWLVFWWALAISLFVLCIAWLRGFFKPFSSGRFPEITGEDVLRGFGLFLAVEGLLIPSSPVIFYFKRLGCEYQCGGQRMVESLHGFGRICLCAVCLQVSDRRKKGKSFGSKTGSRGSTISNLASFPGLSSVPQSSPSIKSFRSACGISFIIRLTNKAW